MKEFLQNALSGKESSISSRRLVTFIMTLVGVVVDIAIIVLAFKVALSANVNDANAIKALYILIDLTIIMKLTIFLLIGIITWQNVNDSASILKGLPQNMESFKAQIEGKLNPEPAPVPQPPNP